MALKGDFIGFTFNGRHSSELGIIRTSDGSRYNSELLPSFNDNTVAVPGGDGTYYFGSYYNQKPFPIQFATDELDEAQFRQLRQWLGDKGIHDLIFDEAPYKVYSAKIAAVPNFNYICFDEGTDHRTYKGEGTIQFVCYYPFARCEHKYLDDVYYSIYTVTSDTSPQQGKVYYTKVEGEDVYVRFVEDTFSTGPYYERSPKFDNEEEWAIASGLSSESPIFSPTGVTTTLDINNVGDLDMDINIKTTSTGTLTFSLSDDEEAILGSITIVLPESLETGDAAIRINSKNNLIEGLNSNGKLTGTLYNKYITAGNFFKVPVGETVLTGTNDMEVEYDYLYY